MGKDFLLKITRQVVFYTLLIAVWEFFFRLKLWPQYLFPSPGQVLETLADGFKNKTFLVAIGVSLRRLVIGYAISMFFGTLLGLVIGKVRALDETVGGFFVGLQTLPSICWLPLAILWFGLSESAITFVVVMGSLLSITIATDGGVKNIQPIYLKAGENMGARGAGRAGAASPASRSPGRRPSPGRARRSRQRRTPAGYRRHPRAPRTPPPP